MRYFLALVAILLVAPDFIAPASAAPSDDAILRCASMTDQQARLACYDRLTPPTMPMPSYAAPDASVAARPPAPQKRGWFSGLFGRSTPPARNIRLTARMTDYSVAPLSHIFTVALDNGQVWRQEQGDTTTAVLSKPPRFYVVTIEPGFLGSFNMHIRDVGGAFKVQRIK